MEIIPAIDLKGGKCVRLRQGKDEETTLYSSDPVGTAKEWVRQGATRLHVVNLDGAFDRPSGNLAVLEKITSAVSVEVEFGGGLRSHAAIRNAFAAGAAKIVVGTIALEDPVLLSEVLRTYDPSKIIVALDGIEGRVATRGWTVTTKAGIVDTACTLFLAGVEEILVTDIHRDGMMTGPDVATLEAVAEIGLRVIASGGISSIEDVRRLLALDKANLTGAIIGKALYEGVIHLDEAIAVANGKG